MQPLDVINNYSNWAIVGVTSNQEKYGYKIFKRLKEIGKNVYGINPKYDNIDNNKIYNNILDINADIDVVIMVVNPEIGIKYLDEFKAKNIKYLWFQPETSSPALIKKSTALGINIVEACVLVVSNYYNI